mmetsp:Transcript_4402/g.5686  ORF Transcript_4402/g.5686 Transcript_4402/m.5686 type:complete len:385 (+) Transcript_4402:227-1381(+)|eukprot:CAMPEP_0117778122 /NCGR_PEP_ID=MMETSP0948-20121206/798_1 /TAXON_ID=44440 /ORGANISM="Chattonella subsalsa, Strain CCMP2191" /LENGTH=384 /DNA_ID=CAMNT_0005605373 /DNA_START=215 /DNA_END=1369 /DNA_ORIENTATION=-
MPSISIKPVKNQNLVDVGLSFSQPSKTHNEFRKLAWKAKKGKLKTPQQPLKFQARDYYAVLQVLILFPLGFGIYVITFLTTFLPAILCLIYKNFLPKPLPRISRDLGFKAFSIVLLFMGLPIITLFLIYLIIIFWVMSFLSLPVGLIKKEISIKRNVKVLLPFTKFQYFNWGDIVICILGMMHRQSFFEFWVQFPTTVSFVPLYKYVLLCNPFLFDLKVKYCNQWTISLNFRQDEILKAFLRDTSFAINTDKNRDMLDDTEFTVLYQFPPPNRKSQAVVGIQHRRSRQTLFTRSQFVAAGETPRGKNAKLGIFVIDLYFFNPFHTLTGYVEVNLTHDNRLEHPMWCVLGDTFLGEHYMSRVDSLFFTHVAREVEEFIEVNNDAA